MNRKEFILHLINKLVRPGLYLILFVFGLSFLGNAYLDKTGNERLLIQAAVALIGIFLVLGLIGFLLNVLWKTLPDKIKIIFKKIDQAANYIVVPFVLYILYENWDKNEMTTIVLVIIFGAQYLATRIKKTKQTKPT